MAGEYEALQRYAQENPEEYARQLGDNWTNGYDPGAAREVFSPSQGQQYYSDDSYAQPMNRGSAYTGPTPGQYPAMIPTSADEFYFVETPEQFEQWRAGTPTGLPSLQGQRQGGGGGQAPVNVNINLSGAGIQNTEDIGPRVGSGGGGGAPNQWGFGGSAQTGYTYTPPQVGARPANSAYGPPTRQGQYPMPQRMPSMQQRMDVPGARSLGLANWQPNRGFDNTDYARNMDAVNRLDLQNFGNSLNSGQQFLDTVNRGPR